jgi:4-diphosphocytidyl-2-C-methyl-D-erythritol kinase
VRRRAPDVRGTSPANDLQAPARALCPAIDGALEEAAAAGADEVLVSGSGPTVLGLFTGRDGARRAREAAASMRARSPAAIAAEPVPAGWGQVVSEPVRHTAGRRS